ncbi:hypothetical protein PISMIDRAFT_13905 [Pisolithus microcarpus 441]|uniref:Uncharacterized protein n=1 Tax=Pisolithus microcarpus 441 TaxID=765257 RepID=A0A0C9YYX7_9AGAM|nr:hypothetical protein PISMIDRAFT_13905 [Pisolithus microcarpus 441]
MHFPNELDYPFANELCYTLEVKNADHYTLLTMLQLVVKNVDHYTICNELD